MEIQFSGPNPLHQGVVGPACSSPSPRWGGPACSLQFPFTKVRRASLQPAVPILGRWRAFVASGGQDHHYTELKSSLCPDNKIKQSEYSPMQNPSSNSNIIYYYLLLLFIYYLWNTTVNMQHDIKQKRRSRFQLYSLMKWFQNKEDWRNNIKYLFLLQWW